MNGTGGPVTGLIPLAMALLAGAALIWPASEPSAAPPAGEPTVATTWPDARPVDLPGALADGAAYNPQIFLDARTSLGTALSPDRRRLRLLLRDGDGTVRELRSLPAELSPEYGGLTVSGGDLAWVESTTDRNGAAATRMWTVNLPAGGPARLLTADTGDAVFFNSQYDTVIWNGRLYWAAVARDADPVTEVRSVSLAGGPVAVSRVRGAFALSGWPWLVSAGTGQNGPVQLHNLDDGREVTVPAQGSELVTCGPAWCRVLVLAGTSSPPRIDLMRPDGGSRRQIASGSVSSAVIDVAALDRFEVLSRNGADGSPTSSQDLLLYDLKHKRTVLVGTGTGTVLCRSGMLWWSTGDNETLTWHNLDLHSLS